MNSTLIRNARIVNEGNITEGDVLIENDRISKIGGSIEKTAQKEIDARGKFLIPGIIDDQVHFREPGMTHKAEIYSEARAAVAGGTTSFMEMPNTIPPATSQELLENKYKIASKDSLANYSFYMGTTNDNLDEVFRTDPSRICGIKIFMGSSTGNMLVDDQKILEKVFREAPVLIATHCEDENTIKLNAENYRFKYGENVPIEKHPEIRSEEACYLSSSFAVELAKKCGTRLHILHISTASELNLFEHVMPLKDKRITAEVCVHHMWFDKEDYAQFGTKIKCNPAIKEAHNRKALMKGLLDNHLDVIATDHAPHTRQEKSNTYFKAPSGIPLIQHSLHMMIEFYHQNYISLEQIVEKMCHAPAICFKIKERGFIREGYKADLVLVDIGSSYKVDRHNLHYKCGWSPFEGREFNSIVTHTFVNGHLAYENKGPGMEINFDESKMGERLLFARK